MKKIILLFFLLGVACNHDLKGPHKPLAIIGDPRSTDTSAQWDCPDFNDTKVTSCVESWYSQEYVDSLRASYDSLRQAREYWFQSRDDYYASCKNCGAFMYLHFTRRDKSGEIKTSRVDQNGRLITDHGDTLGLGEGQ